MYGVPGTAGTAGTSGIAELTLRDAVEHDGPIGARRGQRRIDRQPYREEPGVLRRGDEAAQEAAQADPPSPGDSDADNHQGASAPRSQGDGDSAGDARQEVGLELRA